MNRKDSVGTSLALHNLKRGISLSRTWSFTHSSKSFTQELSVLTEVGASKRSDVLPPIQTVPLGLKSVHWGAGWAPAEELPRRALLPVLSPGASTSVQV